MQKRQSTLWRMSNVICPTTQLHLYQRSRSGEKKLKTLFPILCIVRKVERLEKVTRFECLDSYETEKLGSMLLGDKNSVHFVVEVIKIIDNEMSTNVERQIMSCRSNEG